MLLKFTGCYEIYFGKIRRWFLWKVTYFFRKDCDKSDQNFRKIAVCYEKVQEVPESFWQHWKFEKVSSKDIRCTLVFFDAPFKHLKSIQRPCPLKPEGEGWVLLSLRSETFMGELISLYNDSQRDNLALKIKINNVHAVWILLYARCIQLSLDTSTLCWLSEVQQH